jgi:sugar phosphate isomerase/epimerase
MDHLSAINDHLYISQVCTKPWSLEEDVRCYQQNGLGIELWEAKFSDLEYERQIDWLLEQGIAVSSIQPKVMTVFPSMSLPEPKAPKHRLALMMRTIDRFAKLGHGLCLLTNTGADFSGNEALVWKTCVESYKRLADYAAERHIRIAFEPLGASLMNRSTTISNISLALELLQEVNNPNIGICADCYNLWQSSALHEVSLCGDQLFLVHLADWQRPRNFHDRFIPGEGMIPIDTFLQRILTMGYHGAFVVEIFSEDVPDSLWQQDLKAIVIRSKEGILQAAETMKEKLIRALNNNEKS